MVILAWRICPLLGGTDTTLVIFLSIYRGVLLFCYQFYLRLSRSDCFVAPRYKNTLNWNNDGVRGKEKDNVCVLFGGGGGGGGGQKKREERKQTPVFKYIGIEPLRLVEYAVLYFGFNLHYIIDTVLLKGYIKSINPNFSSYFTAARDIFRIRFLRWPIVWLYQWQSGNSGYRGGCQASHQTKVTKHIIIDMKYSYYIYLEQRHLNGIKKQLQY